MCDAEVRDIVDRVWRKNVRVCGIRKVWRQSDRDGVEVVRCAVECLMRDMCCRTRCAFVIDVLARTIVDGARRARCGQTRLSMLSSEQSGLAPGPEGLVHDCDRVPVDPVHRAIGWAEDGTFGRSRR